MLEKSGRKTINVCFLKKKEHGEGIAWAECPGGETGSDGLPSPPYSGYCIVGARRISLERGQINAYKDGMGSRFFIVRGGKRVSECPTRV